MILPAHKIILLFIMCRPLISYLFNEFYSESRERLNASSNYYFEESSQTTFASKSSDLHHIYCTLNGDYLSGSLFLSSPLVTYYFLSASSPNGLRLSAPKLIIQKASDHFSTYSSFLNLGGGLSGSTLSPLYRFKAGFSSCIFSFHVSHCICDSEAYSSLLNILPLRDNYFPPYQL